MKRRLTDTILFLAPLSLLFACVFTGLRLYEFMRLDHADAARYYETIGFLYDWPFAFLLMLIVLLVCLVVAVVHAKTARVTGIVLLSVMLIIAFLLIQYFSITQVPLSADLFAYSFNDLRTTVRSSGGFNYLTVAALFLYLTFFVGGSVLLMRSGLPSRFSVRAAFILFGVMALAALVAPRPSPEKIARETHYNLAVNKSEYFLHRAVAYFRSNEIPANASLQVNRYPFLQEVSYENVLGPYIDSADAHPNIVFLLVEGLGRDFTGPEAPHGGFTPFLDSLAAHSLYWKNGLSNAGRTFGVLPSILGSLPYGKDGFMSYGTSMPDHQTLISLLKAKGYKANFFYGGNPNFDNQDVFLQYQGLDFMLNESNFPAAYKKPENNSGGFAWGYADRDVFNHSLEILDTKTTSPRLDIYLTLSTHEPFEVPEKTFEEKFDRILASSARDEAWKKEVARHRGVYTCLLYTDDAIREFIGRYKRRPEFGRTIFVITGDHRLIPVPQATKISRFHVPIMIYSPLVKAPHTFGSIALHSDIPSALLGLLRWHYAMDFPEAMPFISRSLSVKAEFFSDRDVALIRNKGEVNDYLYHNYFLSEDRLFEVMPDLDLKPLTDAPTRKILREKLAAFQAKSLLACAQNRLDTATSATRPKLFAFSTSDIAYIREEDLAALAPDALFMKARNLAFEKKYRESRIILCFLLNAAPNYHDARILLARTFAWNGEYDTARVFLQEVLRRTSVYDDAFSASSDVEFWTGNYEKSLTFAAKGLEFNPDNADLLARQARALWIMGKNEEARAIAANILHRSPQHELALDVFRKSRQQ